MRSISPILIIFCSLLFIYGCQKELSFEAGKKISVGNLQADGSGDCLPKNVIGAYEVNKALVAADNYLEIEVNVIETGSYKITTDTVNGFYFVGKAVFSETGLQIVKLSGMGTPLASGISNFVVSYGVSSCMIPVTILPEGGGVPAEIELLGSPNECSSFTLEGSYVTGTALNSGNKVILNVNVIIPGTYNVSTTLSNGITFSAAGSFLSAGANTITLTGSGTPLITGPTNIPITIGNSSCSFSIEIVGPAQYSFDCALAQVEGIYESGSVLDDTHFILLTVDVTNPGGYNITGTVNGMTFASAGNFDNTGSTQIKLTGNGIPSNDGDFSLSLKGGTTTCTVPITVEEGSNGGGGGGGNATGTFKFTVEGKTYTGTITDSETGDYSTDASKAYITAAGTGANGEIFQISVLDANKTFAVNETYAFTSSNNNRGETFLLSDENTDNDYVGAWQLPNLSLSFKTTAVNSNPRSIRFTFSGTVLKDGGNVNVTNGEVNFTY